MPGDRHSHLKMVIIGLLITGLLVIMGTQAVDALTRSSCVNCHTDENALKRNLSPVVSKKSSMTSGAG